MNFQHLAQKYITGAKFVMHDRTYEGLEWIGPGDKPGMDWFEQAQAEEERAASAAQVPVLQEKSLMKERQTQARAAAYESIIPFEERVRAETVKIAADIREIKIDAILARQSLALKEEMLESWEEINATQAIINSEAKEYLNKTDFYVTRKHETGQEIPEEVLANREAARARISKGQEVYANWQSLRANALPSRAEIQAHIKAGGEHLRRIQATVRDAKKKYPKPSQE